MKRKTKVANKYTILQNILLPEFSIILDAQSISQIKKDRLCNQIIRLKKGLSEQDQLVQDVYNYFTSTSQVQRTCAYSTIS
jgi:ABC-type polysaccharide/polyol phosphate transport system ATPase subunit